MVYTLSKSELFLHHYSTRLYFLIKRLGAGYSLLGSIPSHQFLRKTLVAASRRTLTLPLSNCHVKMTSSMHRLIVYLLRVTPRKIILPQLFNKGEEGLPSKPPVAFRKERHKSMLMPTAETICFYLYICTMIESRRMLFLDVGLRGA